MYDNVIGRKRCSRKLLVFVRFVWKAFQMEVYYDMTDNLDKAGALVSCTPFFTVVDKIGSMMSRGIPYV